MGYIFGAANTDKIACGTAVAKGTTFSLLLRVAPTAADTTDRVLAAFSNGSTRYQFYVNFSTGVTNLATGGMSVSGGTFATPVTWETGWAAGSIHTLVFVYDQVNEIFYADTDATAKATQAETRVPDQDAGIAFILGNETAASSRSAACTIYEVAWWPGTVLTGAQCAQLGAGYDALFLHPKPSHHWRLVGDAADTVGGQHGTVTGATVAAHTARIYRPAPRSRVAFTPVLSHLDPTFTVGARLEIVSEATLNGLSGTDWFWPDSSIGVLNNGDATYTFFASIGGAGHAGEPGKLVGTLTNPVSVSSLATTITGQIDAPDATVAQRTYLGGGPVYKDPATGRLIIFAHNERPVNPSFPGTQFYAWLSVLTSTNGGDTWVDCGAVITPHHTWAEMDAAYAGFGKGDGSFYSADVGWGPYLIIGGYFYVYYWFCDGPVTSSGLFSGGAGVARALVSDVVTAAATATVPVFHKYNAGTWTELGIRGTGTTVIPVHHLFVSHNTVRNKYIAMDPFGGSGSIRTMQYRESTDGLTWSDPPQWGEEAGGGALSPLHIYPTLVDPTSIVPTETGAIFYMIANRIQTAPTKGTDRWLITLDAEAPDLTARLLTVLAPHAGGRGD